MSNPGTPPPQIPPVVTAEDPFQPPKPEPIHLFPLPPPISVAVILTIVVFGIALVRLPGAISLGIQYEKAQSLMGAEKNKEAAELLKPLSEQFPTSHQVKMDLALCYAKSAQFQQAATILATFDGIKVSKEENQKLTAIESYFPKGPNSVNVEGGAQ